MFTIGQSASHSRFGEGEILETRFEGFEARVDFGGFAVWLPAADLEASGEAPTGAAAELSDTDTVPEQGPADRKKLANLRLIESLRLGIVPDAELRAWTVGREAEMDALKAWLSDDGHGTMIVEGRYGAGKTHLLRCARGLAEEDGYAGAQVSGAPTLFTWKSKSFAVTPPGSSSKSTMIPLIPPV